MPRNDDTQQCFIKTDFMVILIERREVRAVRAVVLITEYSYFWGQLSSLIGGERYTEKNKFFDKYIQFLRK